MAHDKSFAGSTAGLPVGTAFAVASAASTRIESNATNGHENVSVFSVNGNPVTRAASAIIVEKRRVSGFGHESCFFKNVGNGSGAVVGRVFMLTVPTASAIGLARYFVGGCNGSLHLRRRSLWGDYLTIAKGRGVLAVAGVEDLIRRFVLTYSATA